MDAPAIAAALRELAAYLELEGDRYRARAYEHAARSVDAVHDVDALVRAGRLTELPGVGASIARTIAALAAASDPGELPALARLRARWPALTLELARLPHVGAPRARRIVDALAPESLDQLAAMYEAGAVRELPGFGKVSEARLLAAIRDRAVPGVVGAPLLVADARELGEAIAAHLRGAPGVAAAVACGPARRWVEIVDELAIAVATTDPGGARARLRASGRVASVRDDDRGRPVAVLVDGVACVLHVAPPARFGVAQVVATGAPGHVDALRRRAADRGLELDLLDAPDEASVYAALGLPWLPPEVRDGTDELAAADAGDDFADLIALSDLTGAVHCHTVASDGKATVEEMARAAEARGLAFLTITDHSRTASYAGGLTIDGLRAQAAEIDDVQRRVGVRLLRGTESDILADGSLDYPPEVLADLEVVIASIHARHRQGEADMTRRLVAAMRAPVFKIWGHGLGRLLLHRPPIDVRLDEVLDAIAGSRAAIEINGDPRRLDLPPEAARRARALGVRFVLSADAHSTRSLDYLVNAVGIARRARIRRREVLNALPADEFAAAVRPA